MKKSIIIFISAILIFSAQCLNLPFELREERMFGAQEICPLDINNDGTDELLTIGDNHMALRDQKGRYFWDFQFYPLVVKSVFVKDYNKDDLKEIFLISTEGLTQILHCYGSTKPGDLINRIIMIKGEDKNKDGKWDGRITVVGGIEANDDENVDLLVAFDCNFDLQPRGIAAYDMKNGKELWHYWIGPNVTNVILEDLDNDGKQEIVIGTYSSANGNIANNTIDLESYVIILNRKGKLQWQLKTGEQFTQTLIAVSDIDQDGKMEVIAAQSSRKERGIEPDKLLILDGITGKEERHITTGENFWGLVCADIVRNSEDDIITGNSDGQIRVFNSSLDEIMNFQNNNGIDIMGICDFQTDGRKELLAKTEDNRLLIFDEKLKKIAQLKLASDVFENKLGEDFSIIKPVRVGREEKLLIAIPKRTVTEFVLYNFIPTTFTARKNFPFLTSLFFLALLIILFLHLYVFRRFIDLPERIAKRFYSKIQKTGYVIVNNKGKVLVANQKAEDLLDLINLEGSNLLERLKNKQFEKLHDKLLNLHQMEEFQVPVKIKEEERILSLNVYEMPKRKTYSLRIEDITFYKHLEKVKSWAPVAQKLAHGIKTPLMNIQLTTQQLGTCHNPNDQKCIKLLENVNNEILRLRKITDGFIRFTQLTLPHFQLENINTIIKDLIDRYLISLPPEIKFRYEFDSKIPRQSLDKNEIENALSILIDNAIEALGNHGSLTINTVLTHKYNEKIKDWVKIEITDTGKGIPEKYLKEIFKPYFVFDKPNGTGLGLTIAQEIIENHNGHIEINSKEGIGTSILILIPIT